MNTTQKLGRFYVYEMSMYCGFLPTWKTPSDPAPDLAPSLDFMDWIPLDR